MLGLGGLLGAGAVQNLQRAADGELLAPLSDSRSALGRGSPASSAQTGAGGLLQAQPVRRTDPGSANSQR